MTDIRYAVFIMGMLLAACAHGRSSPAGEVQFDIPAQALASALERYAVMADQTVLFSDALVAGRTSAAVRGRMTPRAALQALLAGTGLEAETAVGVGGSTFVLKRTPPAPASSAPVAAAQLDRSYDGLLQRRVWQALCRNPATTPGTYRAAMQIDVDENGRVIAPHLLSTTGDEARDQAIVATLHGLQLDYPPPAGLPQPVLLVILPRERIAGRACPAERAP
ncbi:MAG: secretin and TonB N-terminal domain-containing protein [Rhodocyclaceae bacterium]